MHEKNSRKTVELKRIKLYFQIISQPDKCIMNLSMKTIVWFLVTNPS